MLLMAAAKEEEPRLSEDEKSERESWAKDQRMERWNRAWMKRGRDEVDLKHNAVDGELRRWGAWSAARYKASSSGSVESRYREQTARTTGESVDPRMVAIDRAVLRLPKKCRDAVRLYYVVRKPPASICKLLTLRFEDFFPFISSCRAMVVNLLRRHGNG